MHKAIKVLGIGAAAFGLYAFGLFFWNPIAAIEQRRRQQAEAERIRAAELDRQRAQQAGG